MAHFNQCEAVECRHNNMGDCKIVSVTISREGKCINFDVMEFKVDEMWKEAK